MPLKLVGEVNEGKSSWAPVAQAGGGRILPKRIPAIQAEPRTEHVLDRFEGALRVKRMESTPYEELIRSHNECMEIFFGDGKTKPTAFQRHERLYSNIEQDTQNKIKMAADGIYHQIEKLVAEAILAKFKKNGPLTPEEIVATVNNALQRNFVPISCIGVGLDKVSQSYVGVTLIMFNMFDRYEMVVKADVDCLKAGHFVGRLASTLPMELPRLQRLCPKDAVDYKGRSPKYPDNMTEEEFKFQLKDNEADRFNTEINMRRWDWERASGKAIRRFNRSVAKYDLRQDWVDLDAPTSFLADTADSWRPGYISSDKPYPLPPPWSNKHAYTQHLMGKDRKPPEEEPILYSAPYGQRLAA